MAAFWIAKLCLLLVIIHSGQAATTTTQAPDTTTASDTTTDSATTTLDPNSGALPDSGSVTQATATDVLPTDPPTTTTIASATTTTIASTATTTTQAPAADPTTAAVTTTTASLSTDAAAADPTTAATTTTTAATTTTTPLPNEPGGGGGIPPNPSPTNPFGSFFPWYYALGGEGFNPLLYNFFFNRPTNTQPSNPPANNPPANNPVTNPFNPFGNFFGNFPPFALFNENFANLYLANQFTNSLGGGLAGNVVANRFLDLPDGYMRANVLNNVLRAYGGVPPGAGGTGGTQGPMLSAPQQQQPPVVNRRPAFQPWMFLMET